MTRVSWCPLLSSCRLTADIAVTVGPFRQVVAARPGGVTQIDPTSLNVLVLLEEGRAGGVAALAVLMLVEVSESRAVAGGGESWSGAVRFTAPNPQELPTVQKALGKLVGMVMRQDDP